MRKLAWAALGLTLGVGLAEYVLPAGELPYFAAALALSAPLAARWLRQGRRTALLALAATAGLLLWWGSFMLCVRPAEALAGQTVEMTATVSDYVERHEQYERLAVTVTEGAPRERALLYCYEGRLPELEPGDVIRVQVQVRSAVERQGERSRIYTSQGVFLLGYIRPDTLTVTGRTPGAAVRYFPRRLCRWVQTLCDGLFEPDAVPFIKGLLTGDTTALEEDTENYTAMRTAGVMHIVAVSGMHMFVLTGFLQLLLGRGRRTSLVCLPVIWLFALMAGGRPSVVRAAVMQSLYLLAPLLRREEDGVTCLSAALVLLLAVNPMAIGGVGLQLSFACMAGLVFLLPPLLGWMEERFPMERRLVSALCSNVACTIGANAFSTPVAAFYFGGTPLYGLLANLLTLFVVEVTFAGAYGAILLGAVWPAAGRALGWLLSWPVRGCMLVYRTIAGLPVASLAMSSVQAQVWLLGVYVLFGGWYWLRRKKRVRAPADVPVCLALLGLCLTLGLGKLAVRPGEGLVTALDVGQGECVVLAGHESTVVVDCGGSSLDDAGDIAADYLQSIGRTRVDLLVLTHLHADHADGVETLLYRMPVGQLILPADTDDADGLLADIVRAAERRKVPVLFLAEEARFTVGDVALELMLPRGGDVNERGIVARAGVGGGEALIMGDAGTEAELSLLEDGKLLPADVLAVGHHGSKYATGQLMLLAVQPETALISVGYNTYGHPAPETLARLAEHGVRVLRTDLEGDVTVRFSEETDGEEAEQAG